MRMMLKLAVAVAMSQAPGLAQAQNAPVTVDMLMKMSPKADREIVRQIVAQWPDAVAAGIIETKPHRVHHFLAQLATETGGFRLMDENLRYSAKRLRQVFPKYVRTDAQAQQLAGNQKAIANLVYGKRLGNDCENDGWNFRGSGLVQLTGRFNFHDRNDKLKAVPALKLEEAPLDTHPKRARTFPHAFLIATSYWTARDINPAADRNDLKQVRVLVNGGRNGLPEAAIWLARAQRFVRLPGQARAADRSEDVISAEEQTAVEDQLVTLRLLRPQSRTNRSPRAQQAADAAVAASLRSFQASRDLPQTGQIDDDTLYALTDPGNFAQANILAGEAQSRARRAPVDCVKMAVVESD